MRRPVDEAHEEAPRAGSPVQPRLRPHLDTQAMRHRSQGQPEIPVAARTLPRSPKTLQRGVKVSSFWGHVHCESGTLTRTSADSRPAKITASRVLAPSCALTVDMDVPPPGQEGLLLPEQCIPGTCKSEVAGKPIVPSAR